MRVLGLKVRTSNSRGPQRLLGGLHHATLIGVVDRIQVISVTVFGFYFSVALFILVRVLEERRKNSDIFYGAEANGWAAAGIINLLRRPYGRRTGPLGAAATAKSSK